MPARLPVILTTACAIAYTLVAHLAVMYESLALTIAAVGLLAATILIPPLLQHRIGAWLATFAVAGFCWLLSRTQQPMLMLYLPPLLGTIFMVWLFGHTLGAGRTPLIAQFIRLMSREGESIAAEVMIYARSLTAAWTWLFAILTAVNFTLALIVWPEGLLALGGIVSPVAVSQEAWSLFANVVQYLIVGLFFVVEYVYRRRRFPQQPYRNLLDFSRRAFMASARLFGGERRESLPERELIE